jgi:hypothetical protein
MHLVRQAFDSFELDGLEEHLASGLTRELERAALPPGASVAIGVGSRGVSPVVEVVRTLARGLREAGLRPFVVPAMGSHGGGTAKGQASVLADYGVHERSVGAPVRATMDTVILGTTTSGITVHLDAEAAAADGVIVIGRVKPHTGFRGPIESGLCKMSVIGLGNRRGAESLHAHPLATGIPEAAALTVASGHLLCGVALVENAFDRPARAEVVPPKAFHATDEALLNLARGLMPRLPLGKLDGLLIDRMGKNISGSGMDPNVVGMWRRLGELDRTPDYGWLAVLGLTPESHGNAVGIGLADLCSRKLADAIDHEALAMNTLTAMALHAAKVPLTLPTDRACYETVLHLAERSTNEALRIGRIRNTLELETFWVSEAVLDDLPQTCEVVESGTPFGFDSSATIVEAGAFEPRG